MIQEYSVALKFILSYAGLECWVTAASEAEEKLYKVPKVSKYIIIKGQNHHLKDQGPD